MEYSSKCRQFLNETYGQKKRNNSNYSKRAFAKSLDIPSSYLIRVMNGILPITEPLFLRIKEHLVISPELQKEILEEIRQLKNSTDFNHFVANKSCEITEMGNKKVLLDLINNWKWFCVLELSRLDDFELTPEYLNKKLGIDNLTSEKLINYLIEKKIFLGEGHSHVKNVEEFFTVTGLTDIELATILRERHRKLLAEIEFAIDNVPQDKRHMSSLVMAYDSDLYFDVVKRISKFRKELIGFVEKKSKKRDVMYDLSVNFIPLTKLNRE